MITNEERKDLVYALSLEIMKAHGYDFNDPLYKNEFDPKQSDSQISFIYEDIDLILDLLEEYGYPLETVVGVCSDVAVDVSAPQKGFSSTTTTHVAVTRNSTLADLKNFVAQLELMEVPDDTVLDGHMSFRMSLEDSCVDRITCGDCGYDDYLLIPNDHKCFVQSEAIE